MNKTPPIIATVRSEILAANIRPPNTAKPVQNAWPIKPPAITPKGFLDAARAIVAICDRSPKISIGRLLVEANGSYIAILTPFSKKGESEGLSVEEQMRSESGMEIRQTVRFT